MPLNAARTLTAASGEVVPSETMVAPITTLGMPRSWATPGGPLDQPVGALDHDVHRNDGDADKREGGQVGEPAVREERGEGGGEHRRRMITTVGCWSLVIGR